MQPTQHGVQTTRYLISPYTPRQRLALWLLAALWLGALAQFFAWWFDPAHVVSGPRFLIITLAIGWITLLPGYFVFFVLRARIADPAATIPEGWRVAMVVTKVPSEPFALVSETLEGMLRQRYPHDVWLADEDPSPETLAWCERHRVRISSRKGVADYHRPDWPRRTRSKEGNLAYFYDHHGYEHYDFVVQLDADHVPETGYLEAMLRPFIDPAVGYVSAPSICDRNAANSWSARSRLYAEAQLHGIMQAGHSNGFAPLCIGSHYAVRTTALRQIGGLGPELAEDHSTTLMMNKADWRGVHALDAIARGYGPQTFADFAIQEFQWARSLTTILLEMTPRCWSLLRPSCRFQFIFSQLWYPLFSTSMLAFLLLPVIALFSRVAWVDVIYVEFLLRIVPVIACLLAITGFLARLGHARPATAKVVSWETALFVFVRWPWSLLGCLVAVRDRLRRRRAAFRITPKPGADHEVALPARFSLPYLVLALLAISPVLLVPSTGSAGGYVIFSALNALIYTGIFALVTKAPEANRATTDELALVTADQRGMSRWQTYALVGFVLALIVAGLGLKGGRAVGALLWKAGEVFAVPLASIKHAHINYGVYDPVFVADAEPAFADQERVAIEHIFVSWLAEDTSPIAEAQAYAIARDRWLMITVEPFMDARTRGRAAFLPSIVDGAYDAEMIRVCRAIGDLRAPVFIRWGHEMEARSERYPWAGQEPDAFIAAYRRFVELCRESVPEAFYVWSPRGDGGLHRYYPGRTYVDYVGLSLYSLSAFDLDHFGHQRPFSEAFGEKYRLVEGFDRPVMIAELGIAGDPAFQEDWMRGFFRNATDFPLLKTVVYFNAVDSPGAWPEQYGVPDWSISGEIFE